MGGDRKDFFVIYAGADRAWAKWVAWQLEAEGYRVELDVWDWAAGRNVVTAISDALDGSGRRTAWAGELAVARATLERALAMKVAAYGPEHPEVARTRTYLDDVQRQLGDQ